MQLEYIGELTKQLVLINYQWFNCERNYGVKFHKEYDIVEDDPFILSSYV